MLLQVKLYDFFKPGWSSTTGHFTALVWTDTTKMGCASNPSCSRPTYVCQYQRPGNVIGVDWSTKVKPAKALSPTATAKASPSPPPLASLPVTPAAVPAPAEMQAALSLQNAYRKLHQVCMWSTSIQCGPHDLIRTISLGTLNSITAGWKFCVCMCCVAWQRIRERQHFLPQASLLTKLAAHLLQQCCSSVWWDAASAPYALPTNGST